MKRQIAILAAAMLLFASGCTKEAGTETSFAQTAASTDMDNAGTRPSAETSDENRTDGSRILIAYFTRLDNTEAELEEILQGGGPYGSLGSSLEDSDLDAVASASIQLIGDEVQGSTEAVARMIQTQTGGDLFSIRTVQSYPVNYDDLIDQGGEERNQKYRPELSSHVENMEEYEVVFLGFPDWWYDMPMAVYSFLEEYDFSGKTVIPFVTSASSGFSGSIERMSELIPGAKVMEPGLEVRMTEVAQAQEAVAGWLEKLGY